MGKTSQIGIRLTDLIKQNQCQSLLEANDIVQLTNKSQTASAKNNLMQSIDKINKELGHNAVYFGAQGIKNIWAMKSPSYTTNWKEIPLVK